MSNNPTPPRIEREAMKYAKENLPPFIYIQAGIKDAYLAGHQVAENRAAPVVKALEEWQALDFRIHTAADAARIHLKAKQILETYKSNV